MDPNANLQEQERLLTRPIGVTAWTRDADRSRLAELRTALRAWLAGGGFAPDWDKAPQASAYYAGQWSTALASTFPSGGYDTMTKRHGNEKTLQIWPSGKSITFLVDEQGEPIRVKRDKRWKVPTAQELRDIRIETRAEIYADRDVLSCDSILVDDLIKAASSGELTGDLADAFSYEEMRNVYVDPSDWTAEQCHEYANDNGLDLPDIEPCEEHDTHCSTCAACGELMDEAHEDESPRGWLTQARDVCRDFAQDNPAEVYEWWRVSSWLCDQLHAIGEVTIDNGYGRWWGRQGTGQMWIMDGTLQKVAAQFEKPEQATEAA